MIPDDIRPLIASLIARSKKREVEWIASSAAGYQQKGDYVVLFPNSSLTITDDDEGRIDGKILNARGDVAITFSGSYRDDETPDYALLSELLELARRKVVRADEALAEIRSILASPLRVGEAPKQKPPEMIEDDEEVPF